jgi:hypothetical protein
VPGLPRILKEAMSPEQYKQLTTSLLGRDVISIADLVDRTPRTLIYGYTLDRASFHVYLGDDAQIHVLTYNEGFAVEGSTVVPFMVLHHSAGPSGGVERDSEYLPCKRVYGHLSDYEFCALLMRRGESPSFTTFPADAPPLTSRYAGRTFDEPGAVTMVNVTDMVLENPRWTAAFGNQARAVVCRVAYQAAADLRLPMNTLGSSVCVASGEVTKLLAAVEQLADALPAEFADASSCMNDFLDSVFADGKSPYSANVTTESTFGGELHFELSFDAGKTLVDRAADVVSYAQADDPTKCRGVSGTFEGRPFVAQQWNDGQLIVWLSQFGDTERFVTQRVRMTGLAPMPA